MDSGRVLIVEDLLVRRLIEGILARGGIAAVHAEPRRALALLEEPNDFALLITNSPQWFAGHGTDIPLLYLAASPDPEWLAKFRRCRALNKPFHPQELLELTRELLQTRRVAAS
jgi:hypothetical protein